MTNEQRPVVWITGGGSGIGRGLALAYAKSGYRVAVSGRRAERLNEVVAAMGLGQDAGLAVACDVTQPEEVEAAVSRIVDTWGRLDIAVANAGFAVSGRVEELSAEEWRKQLDVNVLGVVHTAKAALPALRDVGGRLALVSSVAGFICTPRTAAYCASKFAAVGEGPNV